MREEAVPAAEISNTIQKSEPLFPIAVPDTCLIAQYPVLYEGPYMEDGSHEYVVDVAAIVLFNTARTGIEDARVVLRWENGEYVFETGMVPPRAAVMVLDKQRQKFEQHLWTDCEGTQKMGDGSWFKEPALKVEEVGDIEICVENKTGESMRDVRIYYKSYLPSDELYIGGITYCAGVEILAPGQRINIRPYRYVKGYSKIIRTTYSS